MNAKLKIKGMHCESCAKMIEIALEEEGVTAVVDFKSSNAKISYDEKKSSIEKIISTIEKSGYKAAVC